MLSLLPSSLTNLRAHPSRVTSRVPLTSPDLQKCPSDSLSTSPRATSLKYTGERVPHQRQRLRRAGHALQGLRPPPVSRLAASRPTGPRCSSRVPGVSRLGHGSLTSLFLPRSGHRALRAPARRRSPSAGVVFSDRRFLINGSSAATPTVNVPTDTLFFL